MASPRGVMTHGQPEPRDKMVAFSESPRSNFDENRKALADQEMVIKSDVSVS
jgi:hypothetical protein